MSLATLLAERCTVTHMAQSALDRWNNPTWEITGVDTEVPTRIDQLRRVGEDYGEGDAAWAEYRGLFLATQALGPFDLVETDTERYRVLGPPWRVWGAAGVDHIEARLESLSTVDWQGYPA